jgi:hypothetical protein
MIKQLIKRHAPQTFNALLWQQPAYITVDTETRERLLERQATNECYKPLNDLTSFL